VPFDPHTFAGGLSTWTLFAALYDGLLQLTTDSRNIAPDLATSWSWNSADTQLTFNLRKGVTFQDGTPFDAAIAAQNIQAAAAKGSNTQSTLASMTSAVAVDPNTLRLTFSSPNPGVIFAFTGFAGMEVSAKGLANPSMLTTTPMGISPWKLTSVTAALTYNFDYWPGYWNKSHVYPAHLQILNNTDSTAQYNALATGVADGELVNTTLVDRAKADSNLQLVTYPSFSPQAVFMNNTVAPLNDPNVRKAVALALNRDAFNAADNGQCQPLDQDFLPGMVGYDPALKPTTDVAQAKQLIQAAGATGAKIKMLTIPNQPYQTWAQVAQSQLDAVGLNVTLVTVPGTVYRIMFQQGGYGMLEAGPLVNAPDPGLVLNQYVLGIGNPGTKPPALVTEINAAEQLALGTSQRQAAFQKINDELSTSYYFWAPECTPIYTYAAPKKVVGLGTMQYAFAGVPNINFLQITK
jgi:peptide/nickel transport system substrate-binding protein